MSLPILNTAIVTEDGVFELKTITEVEARELLKDHGGEVDSAVGHEGAAQLLTAILGVPIPVCRRVYSQKVGEIALLIKLRGRYSGVEMSPDDMTQVGYDLKTLYRVS